MCANSSHGADSVKSMTKGNNLFSVCYFSGHPPTFLFVTPYTQFKLQKRMKHLILPYSNNSGAEGGKEDSWYLHSISTAADFMSALGIQYADSEELCFHI